MPIDRPPLRFDHPFAGKVIIEQVDLAGQWQHCQPYGGWACAFVIYGVCHIYVIAEHSGDRDLMRHEIAHCNGWPADHPR